jgi:lytic murein transglycosylase
MTRSAIPLKLLKIFFATAVWLSTFCVTAPSPRADPAFQQWLEKLWPEAQAQGISRATFDMAIRGLEPDLSLPDLVLSDRPRGGSVAPQTEFIKPPADYLSEATFTRLAEQGRKLMSTHRATLAAIEKAFGVPAPVIVAVWGRESAYGSYRLPHNAIRVLATQAYLGRRKEMFRNEFLLALRLLEEGHVKMADMRSSWAGAMGPTQFLPSDFYKFAVDFDQDGKIDIWKSLPDSLASAAKQLVDYGWQPGKPWTFEVRHPKNIDCTLAGPDVVKPLAEWLELGFTSIRGVQISQEVLSDEVSLLLPAGVYGPAFLTFKNFQAIRSYNASDLYALFVGHLADRIAGAPPFKTPWPKLVMLQTRDVEEMQRHLLKVGVYRDRVDGSAGSRTRRALGQYQKRNGVKVDCWPTVTLLNYMRGKQRVD